MSTRIASYFDMIIGKSIGSLVISKLTTLNESIYLMFVAKDIKDFYLN